MLRFDLAPGLVVQLLLLQRLDLGFSEDNAVFSNPGFQGLQPPLEVGEVVTQPDRAHPTGRDKHTALAQLVADPDLTMGGIFDGIVNDRGLGFPINPVLQVRGASCSFKQRLNTTVFHGTALAVKCVS
jgi:hypothetical protein